MSLAGKKKTLIFKEQRLDLFWGFFSLLGVGQTARLLVMKLVLRDPDPFLCRRHQNTKRKKDKKKQPENTASREDSCFSGVSLERTFFWFFFVPFHPPVDGHTFILRDMRLTRGAQLSLPVHTFILRLF